MKLITLKLRNTLYVLSSAFLIAGLLFNFLPARTVFGAGEAGSISASGEILAVISAAEEKITICHIAGLADDPANFVVLNLPPSAIYGVHLDEENGTPLAGHEDDFLINSEEDLARCAPAGTSTPTETPTEEAKITICHIAGLADDPANFVVLNLPASAIYGVHVDEANGTGLAGHENDFIINNAEDLARCAPAATPTPTSTPTATPTEETKITICHIAGLADDPANFVVLNLPASAIYGVHVDEVNGTGLAGHEDDFIINNAEDLARCAPAATPTPTPSPTPTPTALAGVEVIGMCLGPGAFNYGWQVSNPNNFPVDFEWRVNGSLLAGLGSVEANSTADFATPKTEGTIIMVYVGGELQDTATGREDCQVETETPVPTEPPVVPTPPVSSDPTVLIPVTGIGDELPVSLPSIFLNLGFGFFGLGLVAHGLNRRRLEKISVSK